MLTSTLRGIHTPLTRFERHNLAANNDNRSIPVFSILADSLHSHLALPGYALDRSHFYVSATRMKKMRAIEFAPCYGTEKVGSIRVAQFFNP